MRGNEPMKKRDFSLDAVPEDRSCREWNPNHREAKILQFNEGRLREEEGPEERGAPLLRSKRFYDLAEI